MTGWYDTAQICINGHMINDSVKSDPEDCQDYCSRCGSKTLTNCQQCQNPIQGRVHYPNVVDYGDIDVPLFCIHCGNPYPWTQASIEAAKELALESLTEDDQRILNDNLDDLVKDGPKTLVAATRFKKILSNASSEVKNGFRQILIDVISETAKKTLWP